MSKYFIISEYRRDKQTTSYVVAPPGFCRKEDGTIARDGTCPKKSGPEHGNQRAYAFRFKSHRAAARVKNKCPSAIIEELEG